MLVNILIIFFLILITYQIILGNNIIEGLDNNNSYQQYNSQDPLILAQQNAGNIEYLKGRIDDVQGMYKQVQDLSGNVVALQEQVNGLVTAQQDYATQMTGGVAPDITGATSPEDGEPEDTSNLVT
jgi:methyl-accepting chemotaxis protein